MASEKNKIQVPIREVGFNFSQNIKYSNGNNQKNKINSTNEIIKVDQSKPIRESDIKVKNNTADAKVKKSSRSNEEFDIGINSLIIPCSVGIERNSLATGDI